MDARLTAEQRDLRDTAARMARKSAPLTVAGLGDQTRINQLADDLTDSGLLELRDLGSGPTSVEVALVTEQLALAAAEASYLGPTLAVDLCRRAGVVAPAQCTIALTADLARIATQQDLPGSVAIDAGTAKCAIYLTSAGENFGLACVPVNAGVGTLDLTRPMARPSSQDSNELEGASLTADDLSAWRAFAHAVLSADLLGSARASHLAAVEYACGRTQYGRAVATFQAVQHLLAESLVLLEGAQSAVNYVAWAVDAEPADAAVDTALVSKLYCLTAARTINEIAIQVHGGIGNTWECMIHVHLRRALLAGQILGDEATLIEELVDRRLKAA